MTDDELRAAIRRAASRGRVRCKTLLDLAERTGTAPRTIGSLCDEMGIRIASCQLGCFR